jgi:putative nucleotidyltransferase with HDIG domain
MPGQIPRSLPARIFVASVVGAGAIVLCRSLYLLHQAPPSSGWLILALLTLFSGVFTVKVPTVPVTISVSETFVFTSVLLFGTSPATVTVALEALIMSSWRHRKEPRRVLFNATEPTLSIWLASQFFYFLVRTPLGSAPRDVSTLLVPLVVLCVSYFMLNSWLTAIAVGFETHTNVIALWKDHFLWLSLNYFVGASVAALIVQNSKTVSVATLGIILPILIISYVTFKSSMGRVEDANRHLAHVNKMYLSTIETLAMAIDAKDQVTHGHIRRVQHYAVGLSRALRIQDDKLIKAIEAAALLHDMGKLAVPEYILNKPGKLTKIEFERMKLHAGAGADMLSSIEFPYPVIPIVRHHHENWDGTGYPDGLSGANIPIGARILSVVDCFDALTSDRPYRKQLSAPDALSILEERRGSMYDPLVVDAFKEALDQLASDNPFKQTSSPRPIDSPNSIPGPEPAIAGADVTHEFKRLIEVETEFEVIAPRVAAYLHHVMPTSLSVFYRLDESRNELVAIAVSQNTTPTIRGTRIPLAQQLSGWVAVNHETIVNSDAALDLPGLAGTLSLSNSLSAPILSGTTLFGVLALYRMSRDPFNISEQNSIEAICRAISGRLEAKPLPLSR